MRMRARSGSGRLVTVLCVFLSLPGCEPGGRQGTAVAPLTGSEGLVEVPGASLHYRVVGEGEPLLVIHGGPGMEHSYLLPDLPTVVPGRRLVFYDQRGTGKSLGEVDSTTVSIDLFLEDIDAIRLGLGLERIDILAHSFGSFIALRYAHGYPDRIGDLILLAAVEPGFRYADESVERRNARRLLEHQREMDSLSTSDAFRARDRQTVNRIYQLAFVPSFADMEDTTRLTIDFTARTARNGNAVARFLMGPLGRYDDYGLLSEIDARTLIVHGDTDLLPVRAAAEMAEAMPNAALVTVDGAGHFPWIENPEDTRQVIETFLESGP